MPLPDPPPVPVELAEPPEPLLLDAVMPPDPPVPLDELAELPPAALEELAVLPDVALLAPLPELLWVSLPEQAAATHDIIPKNTQALIVDLLSPRKR